MNFVKASLKHRQVTLTVLLIMFGFGIYSLLTMPRREDPRITVPAGLVIAYFPGANAVQVEEQVTKKLEEYLFQYEEVRKDKTYSVTTNGKVELHIWLQDNVKKPDIFWNKLRHQLIVIKAVELPEEVRGPLVNSDFGDTESMIIAIESEKASLPEMNLSMKTLEDQLLRIQAVSKLKIIGEQKEQLTVAFRSDKLVQYDLSISQVIRILQSQNVISASGEIKSVEKEVPMYTGGYFKNLNDIQNLIVGASKTGAVVRLAEIASVKREYSEPDSKITVNGKNAMLLAIQMHEGKNIVKTGREIEKELRIFEKRLPSEMSLTLLVNQPEVVRKNLALFLREFILSVIAVILVVFLLLPLPIAAVAASAIPMTISVTFALLNLFGIELHQVSLASMISVLGIVVDDAIIIADNYVELLDRGNNRWTAAWRSATDLVIPVFTATITIIASFLPLVILTGTIGEFIRALPITVAIALSSSFIVAMVLTPLLCNIFISKGLHHNNEGRQTRKTFFLDILQTAYNRSIEWCLRHSGATIAGSIATIFLAVILYKAGIKQKFFPEAERDQFTVELWMPTATSLAKTEEAVLRLEKSLKEDKRVKSYATFIGRSAPRFYYNYSPEMPEKNFAQLLINTNGSRATKSLYKDLAENAGRLVPEGLPHVKLMQQGQPFNAHIEVRIAGNDIEVLNKIGRDVQDIIRRTPGSSLVKSDFREDFYGLKVNLNDEGRRLGFTTTSVSQSLFSGFSGYTVSKLYEGENQVDIVFRLENEQRKNTDDLQNYYIQSPATGTSVPLRQVADLIPGWQPGRIMHRNGIRTLTIQSETNGEILPSELLKAIRPEISKLELPPGYRIYYGGEYANQQETYSYLFIALVISLLIIFTILLLQFRNLKETGLVMLTIPLSLFGAIFGLFITGNDFGFMAFCGLISLSGIEVRNAIILIDHTNELIRKGMDIPTAAYEAGKRRLRPIFLTAMAAAVGVLPMILSGSPLWSPLASVIAFGVVWSMVISTLSIPVFYTAAIKPSDKKNLTEHSNPGQSENQHF